MIYGYRFIDEIYGDTKRRQIAEPELSTFIYIESTFLSLFILNLAACFIEYFDVHSK